MIGSSHTIVNEESRRPARRHLFVRPFLLGLALTLFGSAQVEASSPLYTLKDTLHLAGPTRWDYLTFDPQHHRLFITRGDSVDVLNVVTKKIEGSITDVHGVHAVALAPDLGKGFISNGATNSVTTFDLATLKTLATVPTGSKPDAVVYDPQTQRVFAANSESGDITGINARDATALGAINLDGQPEFAVVDGKGCFPLAATKQWSL